MREDGFVICSSYALLRQREGCNSCTYRDKVRILCCPWFTGSVTTVMAWKGMGSFILHSMNWNNLISLIDAEIARLHQARSILGPIAKPAKATGSSKEPSKTIPDAKPRKRRKMSPEARAR